MGSARLEDLLGDSSSYTAMTDREKDYFVKLLQEEMHRREDSGRVEQIRDIVRIEDWINSDYYVGSDQKSIYPYWKDFIVDIFRDTRKDDEKINSVILSGCFTGDTRVSLFDGRELSFLELLDEYGYDGKFWVYSCTSDGVVVPGLAHSVHKTKVSTRIAIVKLDNGEEIRCTPDHRFMLRNGSYVEAKDLNSDLLLMSLKSNEYNVTVGIVDSVEIIDSCVDVYDLEVDTYHNFALSSGVFVHNSIGIGKSTVAELIMMRKMYELSCFRNINAMFNLMSKTNIMFLYFSVNQKQAERTGFGEYRALIDNSPYFSENFQRNPRLNSLLVFPEGISYAYGSSANDSIGMSVICSMLDEANFLGGGGPSKDSEKATDLYANIVNRSNSRFIIDGGVNHSLNILVSSATYENSATERQIRLSRNDPHTIVAAPAQWDVKPKNFSKKFFYVFKGSNYLEANIVNSTDDVNNYRVSEGMSKHKYIDGLEDYDSINKVIEELPPHMQSKFLKVPVDLRAGFEANLLRSLQDIGGVSTGSQGKLFSSPMVLQDCIDENRHHPFVSKEIVISTGDDINVKDYLRDDFRLKYPERPRYLHIDQSFRTDSTGISCVYVDSIVEEDGVKKPVFGVDFMLRINPPKPPKKIAIYKIRNFVIYLVNVVGMKIGKLTYDIFNSEESRQILEEMGFNVGYLSVDRTDKPYLDLVEIMYEKRIKLYDYPILRYELLNLLHDRIRRKVDHPKVVTDDGFVEYEGKGNDGVTGTRVGSKDVADSLCGAIQNALQSSVSDAEGNKGTFNDFLMANNIGSYVGIDAPNKLSVEEMIDKQIDDMIDEIEINGGFYR
jgi:DNA gyrase, B subunit|nr:MAG TPA: terminase [Caudoviricetes sp.]